MDLHKVKISELGNVVTGKTPPTKRDELFGNKYPFITPTDLNGSDRYVDPDRYLSEEGYEYQKKVLLPAESTCFVCIGATIGKVCLTKRPSFTNQQINSVVPDNDKVDPKFLYYLLSTKSEEVKTIAGGAATPIVNKTSFSNIEVEIPNLPTQQKIASILSAFDDLIENNTRRIAILEEMARLIYREWFVHYRYPGHEEDELVDSGTGLGEVPEGWNLKQAQDLIDFNPRTSIDKDKERPYLPMGGVSENSMVIDDSEVELRTGGSGTKFRNMDTLFARITPSLENGKTGFVQFLREDQIAIGSTEFIVMRSKKLNPYYVYCLAREDTFRETAIKSMAGASGRQRVRINSIKEYKLLIPPKKVLDVFERTVKPIFEKIHILTEQNKKLESTRNLLLPRLISGKMEV